MQPGSKLSDALAFLYVFVKEARFKGTTKELLATRAGVTNDQAKKSH